MIRTIVVCEAQVPFVHGGAELHVRGLVAELRRHGYRAERVSMPFKWYPKEALLAHAAAWRMVDLSDSNGPVTGLVTDPSSEALGAAISRLAADRRLAASLGDAGYDRARSITWEGVVERLVGADR